MNLKNFKKSDCVMSGLEKLCVTKLWYSLLHGKIDI